MTTNTVGREIVEQLWGLDSMQFQILVGRAFKGKKYDDAFEIATLAYKAGLNRGYDMGVAVGGEK